MKKLSIICLFTLIFGITSSSAFALSFKFDFYGGGTSYTQGTFECPQEIYLPESATVSVDIYVIDWPPPAPPDYGNLAAVLMWFEWDTDYIELDSYSCTDPAWDDLAFEEGSGSLEISQVNSGAGFPGPDIYLVTVVLHALDAGSCEIRATIRDGEGVLIDITGILFFDVTDGEGIVQCLPCGYNCDWDGIDPPSDNCVFNPNSESLGTCVIPYGIGDLVLSYREGGNFITCTDDTPCTLLPTAYCQLAQGDWNGNSCGDVCECYADVSGPSGVPDKSINAWDYGMIKQQWGDTCPCEADCNEDGYVNAWDYGILKIQWGLEYCPACCE